MSSEDEKEKEEEQEVEEEVKEQEVSSSEEDTPVEILPQVDEEDEEQLSVEELEAEIHRLRGTVSKLKSVLWQLGYDSEGKKRI